MRLDYPLNQNAVVFDVGGFEGQWASDIFARYLCSVHVFEPVPSFAEHILHRFARNDRIKVHCTALGSSEGSTTLAVDGDASSSESGSTNRIVVRLTTPESVLASERLSDVDLVKINIEGAEYDLMDHLIETGLVRRFARLQIQFHDFVPDAEQRMESIQARLEKTHRLTYQFPFIWEGWVRRDLSS